MAKDVAVNAAIFAAEAHSNLNLFTAVERLLEGGLIYGHGENSANVTARKILKLCKAETGKQLVAYDRHLGKLNEVTRRG